MTISLEGLIKSKHESSVISFFLLAPNRAFGIRELEKRFRLSRGKLVASLNKLSKAGALKTFSKRGLTYYILNNQTNQLGEIKRSLLKSRAKYRDELLLSVRRLGNVRSAFLSGIFTGRPELPVDLLLVGRINLTKLDKFLSDCKKMLGQEINYSIMSEGEFVARRDTFDRFIKDIFDYPHLVVVNNIKRK